MSVVIRFRKILYVLLGHREKGTSAYGTAQLGISPVIEPHCDSGGGQLTVGHRGHLPIDQQPEAQQYGSFSNSQRVAVAWADPFTNRANCPAHSTYHSNNLVYSFSLSGDTLDTIVLRNLIF